MIKNILKIIGILVCIVVLALGGLLAWLTFDEYDPAPTESIDIVSDLDENQSAVDPLETGDTIDLITWNIGYGALGDNADFFMDKGKSVMTADTERVNENMDAIIEHLQSQDPEIVLLQEVDQNSKRSHNIDEVSMVREALGEQYQSTFALNYKVAYIPYPFPTLGKVTCGIQTLSKHKITESTRVSLPCPFNWPVRTMNLKRCLMIDRIPVQGDSSDKKELVVINLHLEAYDSGAGKIAQTKMLLEILNDELEKGNYVIAGGDFNQVFSNIDMSGYPVLEDMWQPGRINADDFSKEWSLVMDNETPTCRSLDKPLVGLDEDARSPETFQYYMIDGFIVSDNLQVEKIKTQDLGFINSDHNPVRIILTLK